MNRNEILFCSQTSRSPPTSFLPSDGSFLLIFDEIESEFPQNENRSRRVARFLDQVVKRCVYRMFFVVKTRVMSIANPSLRGFSCLNCLEDRLKFTIKDSTSTAPSSFLDSVCLRKTSGLANVVGHHCGVIDDGGFLGERGGCLEKTVNRVLGK